MKFRFLAAFATLIGFLILPASASACDFKLGVWNKMSEERILIKNVQYKIHKSSWETLNFGADLDVGPGNHSLQSHDAGRWGFKVTNLVMPCDSKLRWKFEYKCMSDRDDFDTVRSNILKEKSANDVAAEFFVEIHDCDANDVRWDD
jgi:hypothetical protein